MTTPITRRCSSAVGSRPSLLKMWATCASTVFGDRYTCSEIAWFDRPSANKGKDLSLARRQLLDATAGSSRPSNADTTSGSRTEPPRATRRTASANSETSDTRSLLAVS